MRAAVREFAQEHPRFVKYYVPTAVTANLLLTIFGTIGHWTIR